MPARTVAQWVEIFHETPLPAQNAALRVLGDLTHYNNRRVAEGKDIDELANAMTAFATAYKVKSE